MSLFDYPRINVVGRLRLNPGTANNEDYAQPGSGQALMVPKDFLEPRTRGGMSLICGGQLSKATGLWINVFRNVNKVADDGSGTYVHHVIRGADVNLPGFEQADGVVRGA